MLVDDNENTNRRVNLKIFIDNIKIYERNVSSIEKFESNMGYHRLTLGWGKCGNYS